jgi:3-methylcrotonyl-CoA carboxylase alpha subunit
VDSGYSSGDEVTVHYDPLVAKLVTWAEDRPSAIARMLAALRQTILLGLTNNDQFLQDVLADPDFQSGRVWTTWVEDHFGDWQPPQCSLPPEVLLAAALTHYRAGSSDGNQSSPVQGADAFSPWKAANGFRLGAS